MSLLSEKEKELLLQERLEELACIDKDIVETHTRLEQLVAKTPQEVNRMSPEDYSYYRSNVERIGHMNGLRQNPFFTRIETDLNTQGGVIRIARHSLPEVGIFSWVAPVAALRFADVGPNTYMGNENNKIQVHVKGKEDYTIVDGEIVYLSRMHTDGHKQLIYQKHFTEQVKKYGLSEIVSSMESYQDQVIRAGHKLPLLISGQAGSGKTTVAMHRIAYLQQAPNTAELYPAKSCVVFVQDESSVEYFAHLLPDLGIEGLEITTFSRWGSQILELDESVKCVERYGKTFFEKNRYEYWKVKLIENVDCNFNQGSHGKVLQHVYKEMPAGLYALVLQQEKEGVLDKQDITLLLKKYISSKGELEMLAPSYVTTKGVTRKAMKKKRLEYNCIVVDEFQNYTPTQLQFLQSVLHTELKSVIYVGDLNQQTHIGSIQSWDQIGESFQQERKIVLDKVYRNSSQVLDIISTLGYDVSQDRTQREKGIAEIVTCVSADAEIREVQKIIKNSGENMVGIIAFEEDDLQHYKEQFADKENVQVLTVEQVQGLEFHTVILVGLRKEIFQFEGENYDGPDGYRESLMDTVTDYLYVAMTRAVHGLYMYSEEDIVEDVKLIVKESKTRKITQ